MIGFIGLGRMGQPIVRRLLAAGHDVAVHDIDHSAIARLHGVTAPGSSAAVAARSKILFTCVPGPPEVEAVLHAAIPALPEVATIIEMSTVSPAIGRTLFRSARAHGHAFIDGPLSGGVDAARDGTLVMMAGGDTVDLDPVRDIIACFAPDIFHLGGPGSGYLAKAINQAIYLSYAAVFCESAALGAASGLDIPVLLEVLRRSVAGRPLMTRWEEHIETEDLTPGFQTHRVLKDLSMAESACHDIGFHADILHAVIASFRATAEAGHATHDMTALYQTKAGKA